MKSIVCPNCEGQNIRSFSAAAVAGHVVADVWSDPLRCLDCYHRFWIIRNHPVQFA
jgi:uncharacterized protein with PIN domain